MRNSETLESLRYAGQEKKEDADKTEIITTLRSPRGYSCVHRLSYRRGDESISVHTEFHNDGAHPLTLELLASFSLSGITPFAEDDAPLRLFIHRFRSTWSAEGRHISQPVEDLSLERSWSGHGIRNERFGQLGSMPVRGYFPFVAVEDRTEGVFWGAQLAWIGSWQMEIYRRDDQLCLSGGLADHEFGHWIKEIAPGESISSPLSYLTTVKGDLDECCQRLTSMQTAAAEKAPEIEQSLPVIVNEWCTTWGKPDHDRMVSLAKTLKGSGAQYLVIDAGWYRDEKTNWEFSQGEWIPSRDLFPKGIAATAACIREQGFIPGIWFEFEIVGSQSPLFESMTAHLLTLNGRPVTTGQRRFWDFRDPWVQSYLKEKVIDLLKGAGIGYIKVDYNDTIGLGVDGAESPGEGLRQHLLAVQDFFRQMRREIPDLVIEICSSGGHRLEPSMMALGSMASFSDAHESLEIPIIAANLHRLILPRQSQIWAVLHADDSLQRLAFSIAAGFLGRLCLSGDLDMLSEEQWALVREGIAFYQTVAPVIKNGRSSVIQKLGAAWRHPQGAQAVMRINGDSDKALAVFHSFGAPIPAEIIIPLPKGKWKISDTFPKGSTIAEIKDNHLRFKSSSGFEGFAAYLTR
jgi:alpha-galactosidase